MTELVSYHPSLTSAAVKEFAEHFGAHRESGLLVMEADDIRSGNIFTISNSPITTIRPVRLVVHPDCDDFDILETKASNILIDDMSMSSQGLPGRYFPPIPNQLSGEELDKALMFVQRKLPILLPCNRIQLAVKHHQTGKKRKFRAAFWCEIVKTDSGMVP